MEAIQIIVVKKSAFTFCIVIIPYCLLSGFYSLLFFNIYKHALQFEVAGRKTGIVFVCICSCNKVIIIYFQCLLISWKIHRMQGIRRYSRYSQLTCKLACFFTILNMSDCLHATYQYPLII